MSEAAPRWTTADLEQALRDRFAPPEYAFLSQVRSGTGGNFSRTADGLAMSVWPSRGLQLLGFEIKASRSDWLRELKNPQKAERFISYCDRWYLVVADEAIVQPGELPATWGLMAPKGGKLACKVEAPQLEPKPISRTFLAALLRHVQETCPAEIALKAAVEAARKAGYDEGLKRGKARVSTDLQVTQGEAQRLQQAIEQFEAASGVRINEYQAGRIGEAVKFVLNGGLRQAEDQWKWIRGRVQLLNQMMEELDAEAAAAPGGEPSG